MIIKKIAITLVIIGVVALGIVALSQPPTQPIGTAVGGLHGILVVSPLF